MRKGMKNDNFNLKKKNEVRKGQEERIKEKKNIIILITTVFIMFPAGLIEKVQGELQCTGRWRDLSKII